MRTSAILVALLVLLAGCTTFVPGGPTETTTATSTTVHDMTTSTTTTTGNEPVDIAPGIDADGIENVSTLIAAHQRILLAEGFETVISFENWYRENFTTRTASRHLVSPDGEQFRIHATQTDYPGGPASTADGWANETTNTLLRTTDDETTYDVRERRISPVETVWYDANLQREVGDVADASRIQGVEIRDGVRNVTVTAVTDRVGRDDTENDTRSTLVVDERGVIHRYEVTVDYGEGDVAFVSITSNDTLIVSQSPHDDPAGSRHFDTTVGITLRASDGGVVFETRIGRR